MSSYLSLSDGTRWPDPRAPGIADLIWRLSYAGNLRLTDHERHLLRSILSAYDHLASHPAGTEDAVKKLRDLRRTVRSKDHGPAAPTEETTDG